MSMMTMGFRELTRAAKEALENFVPRSCSLSFYGAVLPDAYEEEKQKKGHGVTHQGDRERGNLVQNILSGHIEASPEEEGDEQIHIDKFFMFERHGMPPGERAVFTAVQGNLPEKGNGKRHIPPRRVYQCPHRGGGRHSGVNPRCFGKLRQEPHAKDTMFFGKVGEIPCRP